jgi:hypothetical protein
MFRIGTILLAAIFLMAAASSPPPVTKPVNAGKRQQVEQSHPVVQPGAGSAANSPLYIRAACEKGCGYAENNEDWWQRLKTDPAEAFAAVMAIFQILLAFATVRAANAARAAAEALPIVERAYLYPAILGDGGVATCIDDTSTMFSTDDESANLVGNGTDMTFTVKNYGKTPAILKEIKTAVLIEGTPDLVSEIHSIERPVLGAAEEVGNLLLVVDGFTSKQANGIILGGEKLIFRGSILFKDIWHAEWETSFLFHWSSTAGHFALKDVVTTRK